MVLTGRSHLVCKLHREHISSLRQRWSWMCTCRFWSVAKKSINSVVLQDMLYTHAKCGFHSMFKWSTVSWNHCQDSSWFWDVCVIPTRVCSLRRLGDCVPLLANTHLIGKFEERCFLCIHQLIDTWHTLKKKCWKKFTVSFVNKKCFFEHEALALTMLGYIETIE